MPLGRTHKSASRLPATAVVASNQPDGYRQRMASLQELQLSIRSRDGDALAPREHQAISLDPVAEHHEAVRLSRHCKVLPGSEHAFSQRCTRGR